MTFMEKLRALLDETNIREKVSMLGAVIMGLATSYVALAEIWNLPGANDVMSTAKIIAAVIATILGARTCIKKLEGVETEIVMITEKQYQELIQKVGEEDAEEK